MSVEIVQATRETLADIEAWLRAEEAAHEAAAEILAKRWDPDVELPPRGFLCNWNLVQRGFERDPANVHVLLVDGAAVGFVWEMDILEVRPDLRGHGYGRTLAEFMVERARDQGRSVAEIEVAPDTALPFWRRMGFTPDLDRTGGGGGIYAFKRFTRQPILGAGQRIPYRVAFHPPERDWDKDAAPFAIFEGLGEQLADGSILLAERACSFRPDAAVSPDCVVRIEVAGAGLFEDKVKRPEARRFGVEQNPGWIYFVDRIRP